LFGVTVQLICFAEFRLRLFEAFPPLDLPDSKARHRHLSGASRLVNPLVSRSTNIALYCLARPLKISAI
jgi:hypothetical protein